MVAPAAVGPRHDRPTYQYCRHGCGRHPTHGWHKVATTAAEGTSIMVELISLELEVVL